MFLTVYLQTVFLTQYAAVNTLNKKSRTPEMGWSSMLELEWRTKYFSP